MSKRNVLYLERVQACCVVVGIVVKGVVGKRGVCFKGGETSTKRAEKVKVNSERLGELAPAEAKRKIEGEVDR